MIWAIWRQHRAEALVVLLTLAALAALLTLTGLQMAGDYRALGVGACLAPTNNNPNCGEIIDSFRGRYGALESAAAWLNLAPLLIGILIGAPLVARELEARTYLLAWTQEVTRRRWLALKLLLIIGGALLVAALFTELIIWWRAPFDAIDGQLAPASFDLEGGAPVAYMGFALALAIGMGTLTRRVIPAMAATIVCFLAVRLPLEIWARPYLYQPPVTLNVNPLASAGPQRGDWELSFGFVDRAGHTLTSAQVFGACSPPGTAVNKFDVFQCVQAHGWLTSFVYQPASRLLRFQITETLIYGALTALLLGLTYWWVQRRIR